MSPLRFEDSSMNDFIRNVARSQTEILDSSIQGASREMRKIFLLFHIMPGILRAIGIEPFRNILFPREIGKQDRWMFPRFLRRNWFRAHVFEER